MKLKKIASLALAGIMAVSMLAGCKDNPSSSSEPTTPPETVTGAAAAINAELDEIKDIVSFTDGTDVQGLLDTYFTNNDVDPTVAKSAGTAVVYGSAINGNLNTDVAKYIQDALNLTTTNQFTNTTHSVTANTGKDISNVNVYVLNGEKLTEAAALKLVGQYLDELDLPEDDGNANSVYYQYKGSVAMVNAKTKGETESVWVIAVVIDRTAESR